MELVEMELEAMHKSLESAMRKRVESILNGVNHEMDIISKAMNRIGSPDKVETIKFLTVPFGLLDEKLPAVVASIETVTDTKMPVDARHHILAALISRVPPKKSYTIGCLIGFAHQSSEWESISWRTVHEILLEQTFGVENVQNNDWDESGRLTTFPEPSRDMEILTCDKLLCGFVAFINWMSDRTKHPLPPFSPFETREIRICPYMSHVSMFVERWTIKHILFDKKGDAETRDSLIESMRKVPSAKFAKLYLQNNIPLYNPYGYVFESFAWPDLLKFIELLHRNIDGTMMPSEEPEFDENNIHMRYRCTRYGVLLGEIMDRFGSKRPRV